MSYSSCDRTHHHTLYRTYMGDRMERVTLRIPEQQVRAIEALVDEGEFPNRSEAIRAAVRTMVSEKNATEKVNKLARL